MKILLAVWLAFPSVAAAAASPPIARVQSAEDWSALAAEWKVALDAWKEADAKARAAKVARKDRPVHPAGAFWPRVLSAARAGEGAGVLWMLEHLREVARTRSERAPLANEVLALVESAGAAPWVAAALPELGKHRRELDAARYGALLASLAAPEQPVDLRVAALLARADLVEREDGAGASRLRLEALELRLGAGGEGDGTRAQLDALARALLEEFGRARDQYFQQAFEKDEDGSYRPREGAPAEPTSTYRPLIESLADAGSGTARVWMLSNTHFADEPTKRKLAAFLAELPRSALAPEDVQELGRSLGVLFHLLGAELVEPSLRELAPALDEQVRAQFLAQLGEALCETAGTDEAQRERGLALMRELVEREPDSQMARRMRGKILRYTELLVGKRAPDFEAVDVEGNSFRLSDSLGKVVVLDFWGFW